jgi:serine/threonine protein phosphatase Stp1
LSYEDRGRETLNQINLTKSSLRSSAHPITLSLVATLFGAASIFGGLIVASEIDLRWGDRLIDWFRESLGSIVIFPILMIAGLVANWAFSGTGMRVGMKPIKYGSVALLGGIAVVGLALQVALFMGHAVPVLPYNIPTNLFAFASISALYLFQSASEEVFFRGWFQASLEQRVHPAAAIIITALIFTGLHYVVEPRHWMSAVNLMLAGIVLGLIYRCTRGLVAPILFHFGFNWSEAVLFGLTPNPSRLMAGYISDFDLVGPLLFGGGDEGLNTNSISAALLVLIGIILLWLINRKPALSKPIASLKDIASPPPSPAAEAPKAVSDNSAPMAAEATVVAPAPLVVVPVSTNAHVTTLVATHPGAVREVNEDRYFTNEANGIWAVADGMGGHRFGDRASTMIVETLATVTPTGNLDERIEIASKAILDANRAIYLEAQENGSRMGSTVVALVVSAGRYALIWAGDSRAYRLRGQSFEQLTRDHTQVQEKVDSGELTPEQAARHPMSHVLVKAIGVLESIELETMSGDIEAGDLFFLCSDGIYDALDDDEIVEQLLKRGNGTTLDALINLAVAQGARDNVTAIAIIPGNLGSEQAQTEGNLNS